ncbi:hypothetical protein IWX90DRAFT_260828 [Phyllosticta citrichinensis]|uniref:Transmembrane protein n=1 Tax=Phyllosticta citrichinensis TaxID=1130410 RepID=A0ABR1XS61_9PEZI
MQSTKQSKARTQNEGSDLLLLTIHTNYNIITFTATTTITTTTGVFAARQTERKRLLCMATQMTGLLLPWFFFPSTSFLLVVFLVGTEVHCKHLSPLDTRPTCIDWICIFVFFRFRRSSLGKVGVVALVISLVWVWVWVWFAVCN